MIKKLIKQLLSVLFIVLGVYFAAIQGLTYWINNPGLTQMEVFLDTWKSLAVGLIFLFVGLTIGE